MENKNQHNYKRPVDEYLPCEEYKGEDGFVKFFRKDDKRHYFSFNNSGTTYLRSQGYQNEPGRDNGIDSIIRNSPLDERWFDGYDGEEKYYYYGLKAGNRQEIARSCRFESKEEMEKSFIWVRGEESTLGKGAQEIEGIWWSAAALRKKQEEEAAALNASEEPAKVEKTTTKKVVDDYLPCEDYAGDEGFSKFFREDRKEYYFALNDDNRKTYLRSEGYTSESGRDNGINSVTKNAPLDARWVTETAMDDKYHYYALKAGNRQEIARSCYYQDKEAMLIDLAWVRGEKSVIGAGSKLVGGALMSAFMLVPKAIQVPEVDPTPEPEPIVEPEPTVKKVAPIAASAVTEKGGCSKWLWWLLPLILLALLCYFFCRGCDDKVIETPAAVTQVVETVTEAPKAVLDKVDESVKVVGGAVSGVVGDASKTISKTADKLEAAITSGDSFVLEGLNFEYNKNTLTAESKVILAEVVAILKKHHDVKVVVEGHTDDKGNDSFNKSLSQRRADSIKNSIIKSGISSSRLKAIGFGERHPIATNGTEEGRAKNRRIEFKIIK